MKPYRPEILSFESQDKLWQLSIPQEGTAELRHSESKQVYQWSDLQYRHPKQVEFFPALDKVVFLGGLGDPGMRMGEIGIFAKTGELLTALNAQSVVNNLEAIVRKNRRKTNFPWIVDTEQRSRGVLIIKIVGGSRVELDVSQGTLSQF